MSTCIYMIRHGESPKTEGNERTRGLTEKGMSDACSVTELLKDEGIDVFISSPYQRAILTLENLAKTMGKEVIVFEDIKETMFAGDNRIVPNQELYPAVRKMFADPELSLPGGETIAACYNRSMAILKHILHAYKGKKIALGTHGIVMTLMMRYFDSRYDVDFLFQTSKPDIYKLELSEEDELIKVQRLWKVSVQH